MPAGVHAEFSRGGALISRSEVIDAAIPRVDPHDWEIEPQPDVTSAGIRVLLLPRLTHTDANHNLIINVRASNEEWRRRGVDTDIY